MNLKSSLLVYNQLPEFVREEYPLFISFLEAYYEFLENNLIQKSKDLRYVSDVDYSLSEFEDQFFKTFASILPKETQVSKEFLIKNILPLYRSKGTIKSFEFLFRILFNEEITIEYPRKQVLRASDGKWVIENVLRTENEIYNEYVSDGVTKEYNLPYELGEESIQILVNGTVNQNYYIRKEQKKIIFKVAPILNSKIKIVYLSSFNISVFQNCKITGVTSQAYSIIEKVGRRTLSGSNFLQFFIEQKNIFGTFKNGEVIRVDLVVSDNLIPFYMQTLSVLETINIIEPGSNYEVGDLLTFKGLAERQAVAVVDSVSSGFLESLKLRIGNFGAGYKVGNNVFPTNVSSENFLAFIDIVDDSGLISPNTIKYNTDIISNYLALNISDVDYGFSEETQNIESVISQSLNYITVNDLGPALNAIVSFSDITPNQGPIFLANSTNITEDVRVADLNSIGTIKINSGGVGYKVGDKIVFNNTINFSGQGANAEVSQVSLSGAIRKVRVIDGGYNYSKDYLPTLTVDSLTGSNANVVVEHFMGQDAIFDYESGDGIPGKILSVRILDTGSAYRTKPVIEMVGYGDSNALLEAQTTPSFVNLPGRWITSDGMLSTDEIKLQGQNYYVDFSYVISSQVEFQRYKKIVADLLNPSGMINYARYSFVDTVSSPLKFEIESYFKKNLVGTVNVSANSVDVIGNGTLFEIAESIGILSPGSYIIVNSEIKVVDSIINNTYLTVSESFNYNSNDQIISTMNDYDGLTTETWIEKEIEGGSNLVITTEGVEE
jgi:hypothetical protein